MARKITQESVRAFLNGNTLSKGNMTVTHSPSESRMYLHGNLIARRVGVRNPGLGDTPERIEIMDADWQTVTTKERLNGLLSELTHGQVSIFQRDWQWYIARGDHNEKWEGGAVFTGDGMFLHHVAN